MGYGRMCIAFFVSLAVLVGCDEQEEQTPAAEPASAEQPAVAEQPVAEPAVEEPAEAAPAAGERVEATIEAHFPTELAQYATAPSGDAVIELGLVKVTALDGMGVDRTSSPGDAETYDITGAPAPVAAYAHNPAGDEGEDCPTLEAARGSLSDAEIDTEKRLSSEWDGDGPMYGEEIDILIFHSGEQAGFFVRKRFDHGDDYTDICFASGTPQAPAANMTMDEAKALAGAFVSAREVF